MQTLGEYVRDILVQIKESHSAISSLEDKPGDLEVLKRESGKIDGLVGALPRRMDGHDALPDIYKRIRKKCAYYSENYYFYREMEIMSDLYGGDPGRLRHMRLKILESLADNRFMETVSEGIDELEGL